MFHILGHVGHLYNQVQVQVQMVHRPYDNPSLLDTSFYDNLDNHMGRADYHVRNVKIYY